MRFSSTSLVASAITLSSIGSCHVIDKRSAEGHSLGERSINNGMALKVMPFGASITVGQDSTDGNGYRLKLQDLLENNGNTVSFVGSVEKGTMQHNSLEAHAGYKIAHMDSTALNDGAYAYLPNIILINLGTDDCNVQPVTSATAPADYKTLLAHIKTHVPHALVVASSLLHNRNAATNSCVVQLNKGLQQAAEDAKTGGQKVVWVDMYDAVPIGDINTKDGTHPNDAGYGIMAEKWYDALMENAGLISAAEAGGKPAPDGGVARR